MVVATVLASGIAGGPVTSASGGGTPVDQTRLIAVAERLKGAGGDGYAGISLAPEAGELTLYWNGALPATVERAVERARREAGVRVLPAAHSERELLAAARRLAAEPGVTSVGPKVDGSGLRLGYVGSVAAARSVPAIRDAGVAVDVERGEYVRSAALAGQPQCAFTPVNRQFDWCPYSGGARFTIDGGWCTTGWSVRFSYPPGGSEQYQLTAGHCGSDGQIAHNGAGAEMGTVEQDHDSRDIMLIRTPSAPTIFAGPWSSNTLRSVRGTATNYVGAYVCTSGSMSGEHCGLRVEATNQWINLETAPGESYRVGPVVLAASVDGSMAVAKGDSGGPVASQAAPVPAIGFGLPYGVGTISGGDAEIPCPRGSVASQGTKCFQRVWYAPLQESLGLYQSLTFLTVSLMTG